MILLRLVKCFWWLRQAQPGLTVCILVAVDLIIHAICAIQLTTYAIDLTINHVSF